MRRGHLPSRIGYKKSKTGCDDCKRRKVKCDEAVPCSACKRHQVACSLLNRENAKTQQNPLKRPAAQTQSNDYLFSDLTSDTERRVKKTIEIRPARLGRSTSNDGSALQAAESAENTSEHLDPVGFLRGLSSPCVCSSSESSWLTDMKLFHHYTSVACLTIPSAEPWCTIWQIEIPNFAVNTPYLMHQLLAISAYHLTYLSPDLTEKYTVIAAKHQNKALQGIQAVVKTIDNRNCHTVFAATSLLTIAAFARHAIDHQDGKGPGVMELLEVFILIRGMAQILETYNSVIKQGAMGPLVQPTQQESSDSFLDTVALKLQQFKSPPEVELDIQEQCKTEATCLAEWIQAAQTSTPFARTRVPMAWATRYKPSFFSLLQERHPAALLVLSYICVIMDAASSMHWFYERWGKDVFLDLYKDISPAWSKELEWQGSQLLE